MGNTIKNKIEVDKSFTDIHKIIIDISQRLLLKYDKYLNKSVCKKLLNDSKFKLKEVNKIDIFKLLKKIYLPKNKKKVVIVDNNIEFSTSDFISVLSKKNIKVGGDNNSNQLFFIDLPEFRQTFLNKNKNETTNNTEKSKNKKEQTNKELQKLEKINNNLQKVVTNLNEMINEKNNLKEAYSRLDNSQFYNFNKKKILNNKSKLQKISKNDACQLILEHYVFRIKLISKILDMFKKTKKGYYNQCYSYFKSLTDGKYCIPNIDVSSFNKKSIENINTNKLIKKIFKDVKNLR